MAMADRRAQTKGVDSLASSHHALGVARQLSVDLGSVICISGETDYVVRREQVIQVKNGHSLMPKVRARLYRDGPVWGVRRRGGGSLCGYGLRYGRDGHRGGDSRGGLSGTGQFPGSVSDALYGMTEKDMARIRLGDG